MNKKSKIIILLATLVIIGVVSFPTIKNFVYNMGKRDIQSEKAVFTISSQSIVAEFTANADASNKKYLEKPVAINGTVTSVNGKEVILDDVINCTFLKVDTSVKKGQKLTIKGRVIGYDDLLGELKMDQCNVNK